MKWVSEEAEKEEKAAVEKEEEAMNISDSPKMQMQEFIGPSSFVKHENLS